MCNRLSLYSSGVKVGLGICMDINPYEVRPDAVLYCCYNFVVCTLGSITTLSPMIVVY